MEIPKKISKFLQEKKIKTEKIEHKTVYAAFDKAATLKVSPKVVGKTLILKFNKNYAFVLIPTDKALDKIKFKRAINSWLKENNKKPIKKIDFAKEAWMKKNLKGVKVGAIPPFGEIWKLPTFADKILLKNKNLIISGGDYNLSLKISTDSLKKLENLVFGSFSKKIKGA